MRGNKKRILESSVELFNNHGAVTVSTNHIAKHLKISPGNLYFHFSNKEEIIRELFARMSQELQLAWDPERDLAPREFLEASFDVFWTFRFFHREMYHLRRQDPELARNWKRHMTQCQRLLKLNYNRWVEKGAMRAIDDAAELKLLSDSVLLSSSAYLGFFESPEKPASRRVIAAGLEHVNRLLWPYYTPNYREGQMSPLN
jgi:AcrR family transcriptional regulator